MGKCLLPLLSENGWQVTAFSQRAVELKKDGVTWWQLPLAKHSAHTLKEGENMTPYWICVAPIWVLPEHFNLLEAHGAQHVVVLSSTSRFTKSGSSDPEERTIATKLANAEMRVQEWAENRGMEWVILRPTLIYGLGRDKNITEIARFIRRFGFFPLFGKANGLRQPIHVQDVANACIAALKSPSAANKAYNLTGGEILTYREMVMRVFIAFGYRPRVLTVPLWIFSLAVNILRYLLRYRSWTTIMAKRMNQDMVFDHTDATRDFGFNPKQFLLNSDDIPS